MWLTGAGSVKNLISVVFVADGHPSCRAEGDFVSVLEDDPASSSRATGEAFVRPLVFDQPPPPPPLSQSDYMVSDLVNTVPVGGRLSLFVDHWVKITQDHFIISVVRQGFLISVQNNGVFSGHRHDVWFSRNLLNQPFSLCPPWKRTKYGAQSEPSNGILYVPYRGGRRLLCLWPQSPLTRV